MIRKRHQQRDLKSLLRCSSLPKPRWRKKSHSFSSLLVNLSSGFNLKHGSHHRAIRQTQTSQSLNSLITFSRSTRIGLTVNLATFSSSYKVAYWRITLRRGSRKLSLTVVYSSSLILTILSWWVGLKLWSTSKKATLLSSTTLKRRVRGISASRSLRNYSMKQGKTRIKSLYCAHDLIWCNI